jgi:hypothetical protein
MEPELAKIQMESTFAVPRDPRPILAEFVRAVALVPLGILFAEASAMMPIFFVVVRTMNPFARQIVEPVPQFPGQLSADPSAAWGLVIWKIQTIVQPAIVRTQTLVW